MRVSSALSNSERVERQALPPSPLKGERGRVGLATTKPSREDAAEWVRQNLPTCSAIAADFRDVFGEVRMTYASEGGYRIGTPMGKPAFSVSGEALRDSLFGQQVQSDNRNLSKGQHSGR